MFGENIRAVIPQAAMSAGTMVACSCKEILMGKQSSLGPIDPHLRGIPAQGVLDEFKKALEEYKADHDSIMVWKEILGKYQPTFLGQCNNAVIWTKAFVEEQLTNNMFHGEADAAQKAAAVVAKLSDANITRSHERHLPAATCAAMGLKIKMFEDDNTLQDLLLTTHHCYMHTLSNTGATKIIENHSGAAFIKSQQMVQQFIPVPQLVPPKPVH
jgi:membrane-bound ClpP family serine protease